MTSERKCSKAGCGAQEIIGKPCTDFDCPQQWVHHTRAAPDVPELVRYGFGGTHMIEGFANGEYVLHSQAAEIIAAKQAENNKLREVVELFCSAHADESGDPNYYLMLMETAFNKAQALKGESNV